MARTFTTSFSHNGKTYAAVITQTDSSVIIYVPDEGLHTILPDGRTTLNLEKGLQIDTPSLSPSQHLVLNILTSIDLQKTPLLAKVAEE